MKPKVIIFMEGGLIQHVVADSEVDVTIVDRDTEGAELEEVSTVLGDDAYVMGPDPEVNADFVEKVLLEIKSQGADEE